MELHKYVLLSLSAPCQPSSLTKAKKEKKKLAEEIMLLLQGEKQRLSESPEVTQRSLATQVVHLSLRRVQSNPHSPLPPAPLCLQV